MHAAHSSAALICNAFGIRIGREEQLAFNGLGGGLAAPLRVEVKQAHLSRRPASDLDVLAAGSEVCLTLSPS